MDEIVLDASAVVAMLQEEPGGEFVLERLEAGDEGISMSAVTLCEIVTHLVRQGATNEEAEESIARLRQYSKPFDDAQALAAGAMYRMTRRAGLSLGDRACLALAKARGAEAWTTDRAWAKVKVGVKVRLMR